MKKILLGSVATGALIAAGSANAADLGPRPAYKAPPMVAPVPVFSWTGCFVGAHGGWGWGKKDVSNRFVSGGNRGPGTHVELGSSGFDTSGAIFGGQIGCDYQFAGNWVIGIQGDFAGMRLASGIEPLAVSSGSHEESNNIHVRTDWLASITGRLGFTGWIPRTLLYVRGGGAWVRDRWDIIDVDFINSTGGGSESQSISQTRTGWTIGGGIEYAIAPNWSVFAEFNHYDFGTKKLFHASNSVGHSFDIDTKQRIEAVRLGVNYRFNWGKGKAPVVARY